MLVGVMDSGAGGLSILNTIHKMLPGIDLLYLADEAFAPYGEKTPEQLQDRIIRIGRFFECKKAGAIVVACNTATVAAIESLRVSTSLPIIGVEPAVKPAFRISKKRKIAVLATPLTARSERLKHLISLWKEDAQVNIMSSSSLAFEIDLWPDSRESVVQTVRSLCEQMRQQEVDTLVLACTHYPLIRSIFEQELGEGVDIIEPSEGVTAQLIRRLKATYPDMEESALLALNKGRISLCSTQGVRRMAQLSSWVEDRSAIIETSSVSI